MVFQESFNNNLRKPARQPVVSFSKISRNVVSLTVPYLLSCHNIYELCRGISTYRGAGSVTNTSGTTGAAPNTTTCGSASAAMISTAHRVGIRTTAEIYLEQFFMGEKHCYVLKLVIE